MGMFSDLFGSSGGQVGSVGPTPWSGASPYLKYGLGEAKSIYQGQKGSPAYQGSLYAGLDPRQVEGANSLFNFSGGQGANLAALTSNLATANAGAGANFGSNASSIFSAAGADPTQSIIANAGKYASSPFADQMVDAATRDVRRQLFENDLPGLNNSASATGNLNSSRTGAMEGVLRRGAADRVADISADIRGGLYNTGLGMAQSQHNQGIANQLSANSAIGQAGAQGADMANMAQQMGFSNADAMARAGSIFQQDAQGKADEAYNKWNMTDTRQNDLLNRYWSTVQGTPMGGGSSYQTQGSTGIIPQAVGLGIAAYGAGLFG
jgi:hypothetical protein